MIKTNGIFAPPIGRTHLRNSSDHNHHPKEEDDDDDVKKIVDTVSEDYDEEVYDEIYFNDQNK